MFSLIGKIILVSVLLAFALPFASTAEGAAVAISSGMNGANPNWRPNAAEGGVGGGIVGGFGRTWWTPAGAAWRLAETGVWSRVPGMDLPVPVDEVLFISESVLHTITGRVFHTVDGAWTEAEPFPG